MSETDVSSSHLHKHIDKLHPGFHVARKQELLLPHNSVSAYTMTMFVLHDVSNCNKSQHCLTCREELLVGTVGGGGLAPGGARLTSGGG